MPHNAWLLADMPTLRFDTPQSQALCVQENMREQLSQFLSDFHRSHLKAKGFRKKRHTFTRQRNGYVEIFQFQGDKWNSVDEEPWHCFLNIGVIFDDLAEPRHWAYIPKTHWARRPGSLNDKLPSWYAYGPGVNISRLAEDLDEVIEQTSDTISENITEIRQEYLEKEAQRKQRMTHNPSLKWTNRSWVSATGIIGVSVLH